MKFQVKLRTEVEIAPYNHKLNHSKHGLILGSCFAQNIGRRMQQLKMPIQINSYGVLFNPASICSTLNDFTSQREFTADDLIPSNGLQVSLAHHSSLCATDPNETLRMINNARQIGSSALAEAEYLIITLGTAWAYEYRATGRIVGNCHKLPANDFVRRRLSVEEIVEMFQKQLNSSLSDKKIIFTVSPIRHLADGMAQNQLSKSTLILAVHEICESNKNCTYFPSFEIMMDDLRDYRFYERDLVHPSELAIDYIWECFCNSYIEPQSVKVFDKLGNINAAMNHRPLNQNSAQYTYFKQRMLKTVKELKLEHPELDFGAELDFFNT